MEDAVWKAFLKKYDRIYDPAANELATLQKELRELKAKEQKKLFPPGRAPRSSIW